jgi:hypothetical protein
MGFAVYGLAIFYFLEATENGFFFLATDLFVESFDLEV